MAPWRKRLWRHAKAPHWLIRILAEALILVPVRGLPWSTRMGKQQQDEIEVVVDLEDLIVWEEDVKTEPNNVLPPPPPPGARGEFEGWDIGEEDLT